MDFEKEMQKALKEIFQNIQALEDNRVQLPNKFRSDLLSGCGNRRQRVQRRRLSTETQNSSESDASSGSARSVNNSRKMLFI